MAGTVCERRRTDNFVWNLNKVTTWNTQTENNIKIVIEGKVGGMHRIQLVQGYTRNKEGNLQTLQWKIEFHNLGAITFRLTFLTHSVRLTSNFQGLTWFEIDGFVEDGFY